MKKILTNLLLVSISTLIAFASVEFVLRQIDYPKIHLPPKGFDYTPFILEESYKFSHKRSIAWFYKIIKNQKQIQDGFKVENEFYPFKRTYKKRILAVGDSGTFGTGVRRIDAWPSQLEKELSKSGESYEVFNFGVPGALVQNTLVFYKNLLSKYEADVVTFGLFMANDINQTIFMSKDFVSRLFHDIHNPWYYRLKVYKLFYLKYLEYKSFLQHNNEKGKDLKIGDFEEGEIALYLKKLSPSAQQALSNFEVIMKRFKSLVENRGQKFYVVFIPTKSQLQDDLDIQPFNHHEGLNNAKDILKKFNISESELDFDLHRKRVTDILDRLGIEYADTTEEFKQANKNAPILLENDDHPNEKGHKIMAIKLSKKILN